MWCCPGSSTQYGDCRDRCRKHKMTAGRAALLAFGIQAVVIFSVFAIAKALTPNTTEGNKPDDRPYKGRLIGKFEQVKRKDSDANPPSFKVDGALYAVDEQLLYIHGFVYDGGIPGMLLWGIIRDPRTRKETAFIIPTLNECTAPPACTPMTAVWEENLMVALPRQHTFESIAEIAVGIRDTDVLFPQIRKKYASVLLPSGFQYPRAIILPTRLGHSVITGGVSSGQMIVQDSRRIFMEKVTFDGSGPGAYFWVDRSYLPTTKGFMVAPNNDEIPPLPLQRLPRDPLTRHDVLLDLRRAYRPGLSGNVQFLTVFDIKSVAIYNRQYETVFGDAPFDGAALKGKVPAALDDLTVHLISDKAGALLRDLGYQIGIDNGIQVRPYPTFPRTPPPNSRIQLAAASSGEMLNDDPGNISAITATSPATNAWNCETLDDTMEIQWRVQTGFITVTLSVPETTLPHAWYSYLAFGISGSQKKSQMLGSDVTLGFLSEKGLQLADFVLGERTPCNLELPKVDAVCPRNSVGGKQVSRLVGGGGIRDGKFTFSYRRPLETTDILGKDIPLDFPVYVIWSMGPVNTTTHLPGYHSANSKGSSRIHFGRLPKNNCEEFRSLNETSHSVPPKTTGFVSLNDSHIPVP